MRPERVRILGKRYRIQYVEGEPLEPDDLGEHDGVKQLISIRDKCEPQVEQSTVLHECLEAMDEAAKIGLKHTQIEQLETCLMQLLRENPKLVAYLRKKGAK